MCTHYIANPYHEMSHNPNTYVHLQRAAVPRRTAHGGARARSHVRGRLTGACASLFVSRTEDTTFCTILAPVSSLLL